MVFGDSGKADLVISLKVELEKAKENLRKAGQEFKKAGVDSQKAMENYDEALGNVDKSTERLRRTMNGVRQEFPAWALSTMFFGMQMVSVFKNVWTSATKTFNDIMHSVEGTVTAFDHLEGATTYLRFVAGQALEPFVQYLLPIIDAVSDWIENNQELFRILMAIFGGGGAILLGIGLVALNINAIAGALATLKANAIKAQTFNWASLGSAITTGIGVVSIFWAMKQAEDAFHSLQDDNLGDAMVKALSSGFMGVGGIRILTGKKGGGYLVAIGVGFELVSQNKLFTTISRFTGIMGALIMTMGQYIGHQFSEGLGEAIRTGLINKLTFLLSAFSGVFGLMPGVQNSIKNSMNKLLGGPSKLKPFDFGSNFQQNYADQIQVGRDVDAAIGKGIDWLNELVPDGNGTTNNYDNKNITINMMIQDTNDIQGIPGLVNDLDWRSNFTQ